MYLGFIKRILDLIVSIVALIMFMPLYFIVYLTVKLTSKGPGLYWSKRVGRNNLLFNMPKFRTMKIGTEPVATHLLGDAKNYITPVGKFLRKSSLDELPQLWSIIKGDMSIVGPRPALFNQDDLVELRTNCGVEVLTPGLTGWAQINGRDEIPIPDKVKLDLEYLDKISFFMDIKIIIKTFIKVFGKSDISH